MLHRIVLDSDAKAIIRALAFTPDNKSLVAAGYKIGSLDFFVRVWNLNPLEVTATYNLPGKLDDRKRNQWQGSYREMVLSRDGSTVAWVSGYHDVYVAKLGEKERPLTHKKTENLGSGIYDDVRDLSADGKLLLTRPNLSPTEFWLWDTSTGKLVASVKTNSHSGQDDAYAEFSPDGKRIVITDPGAQRIRFERITTASRLN